MGPVRSPNEWAQMGPGPGPNEWAQWAQGIFRTAQNRSEGDLHGIFFLGVLPLGLNYLESSSSSCSVESVTMFGHVQKVSLESFRIFRFPIGPIHLGPARAHWAHSFGPGPGPFGPIHLGPGAFGHIWAHFIFFTENDIWGHLFVRRSILKFIFR